MFQWVRNQAHEIVFVMVDSNNNEVTGLGASFTIELRKVGGNFIAGDGVRDEIGGGWYRYTNAASEADTPGPVAIMVTGAGAVQQNLVAVVDDLRPSAIEYTYTVTNSVTSAPVEGVEVWVSTDASGANVIMTGLVTDSLGVARDSNGNLPRLDAGTYYFWKHLAGYVDDQNPDTEVVS